MAGDAFYPNCKLRLHGGGANGATTFADTEITPKTSTALGNAKYSNTVAGFAATSFAFDGSGDAITFPDSADWNFGTGDFTITCRVYNSDETTNKYSGLIVHDSIGGTRGWLLYLESAVSGEVLGRPAFSVWSGATTVTLVSSLGALALNTWTHVQVCRISGVFYLFVGGALAATNSANTTLSIGDPAVPLCIGGLYGTTGLNGASQFTGYLDEIDIIKGQGRHSATFTPPTVAYVDYAGQVSGTVTDASGANAARVVRAYRRDTGALVGSATSDGTTGAYSINAPTFDEVSLIVLDNATSGTIYNDLIDRVIPA